MTLLTDIYVDSVLERMKPSLEKHKGCDIIDVNPGAGIWSSKLHEFLKPRTHILLEPDTEIYGSCLQPLLDAKDSKYRLHPKSGVIWAHLEKVISDKYLPSQEPLPRDDPQLEKPNDTLLFVANLAYNPKRPYKAFSSLTQLVIHQLMSAVRSHSLFHRYGMVRMLLWIADEERMIALPRHIAMRKKSAIEAEISCKSITEIASSTRPVGVFRRDEDLETQKTLQVLSNMEKLGITTPVGRESQIQKHLMLKEKGQALDGGRADNDKVGFQFLKELADLEEGLAKGDFTQYSDIPRKTPCPMPDSRRNWKAFEKSPQWIRLAQLRLRKTATLNREDKIHQFVTRQSEIMNLQREVHSTDKSDPDYETQHENLMELMQEFKNDVDKIPAMQTKAEVITQLDEHRLLGVNPPGFLFDRREMEPLKVKPEDFFPDHELALIDFQPQNIWPVLRENYPANYDEFEYILSTMMTMSGQPVAEAIKAIWPGAYDWIEHRCPSLTNPYKGGDMDITQLRVRCLSTEMLKEIFEAWMSWPFKPTRIELLSRLSEYDSVAMEGETEMGGDGEGIGSGSV